jgi:hypothetical protein
VKKFSLYLIFYSSIFSAYSQELTLNGVYRGKDIFVQNPFLSSEGAFCISYISVNEQKVIESPATSAVKIDLTGFSIDDPVSILIHHHSSCLPKVLNPEVLNAGSTFKFMQTTADEASISWVTTGEMPGDGIYVLKMLKMDGWIPLFSVPGKGNLDNNQYSVGVDHYSGDNRYRLTYTYDGQETLSEEFTFYSDLEPITYYPDGNVYNMISLSRATDYVVKNYAGEVVLKGVGQDINVEPLAYGEFTLILENREETFFRPEPELIDRPRKKRKKRNGSN